MSRTHLKRRYRFPDRAAAEDAHSNEHDRANAALLALDAAIAGELEWKRGTFYHVARWGAERMDGGLVLVRFMPSNGRPSTTVYREDAARRFGASLWGPTEEHEHERRELRDLIGAVIR